MITDKIKNLSSNQLAQLLNGSTDVDDHDEDSTRTFLQSSVASIKVMPDMVRPEVPGYTVTGKLGEGGMGTVWRAIQNSTQRVVALKALSQNRTSSARMRLRFEREIELTARLEHPNIGRLYDSGINDGLAYYAMELFEGVHLNSYIHSEALSQKEIVKLFQRICDGLQYAHQRGVIHRDLKPSNILVTEDGEPHIVDFGLAKTLESKDKGLTISITGELAGTPSYMSPEQIDGGIHDVDTRSDIYSLGVMLYRQLIGAYPYDVDGPHYQVFKRIKEDDPHRPSKLNSAIKGDLEAILLKSLEKECDTRYQSVAEISRDLDNWLSDLPVIARPVTNLYLLGKLIRRKKFAFSVTVLLIAILLSCSAITAFVFLYAQAKEDIYQSNELSSHQKNVRLLEQAYIYPMIIFLEDWHANNFGRAQLWQHSMIDTRPEKAMMGFLLDTGPLEPRLKSLTERIGRNNAMLTSFALAEVYRKENRNFEAVSHYNAFLAEVVKTDREVLMQYFIRATRFVKEHENATDTGPSRESNDT